MEKVILIIRDGWGYRAQTNDNAIYSAKTPNADRFMLEYPNVLLGASGQSVGLPDGFQGNSEVGHMTIGSGRIIPSSAVRINDSIKDGDFFVVAELNESIENCKKKGSVLHVAGLVQVEAVHAHLDHLFAILELCKRKDFHDVKIHVMTDGRDSPVHDSLKNVGMLQQRIEELGFGEIVTVSGRYYAMDRNKKWERTEVAYKAIVEGDTKEKFSDALSHIKKCHERDETDEFIVPAAKEEYKGIEDGDSFIFFNFRTDRPRQLTRAIVEDGFRNFEREKKEIFYVAMTPYYKPMNAHVAFKDIKYENVLGKIISEEGLKQLRISETEKYAHVTFFFNAQVEKPYPGEERVMIPSPKVATYDMEPEMEALKISDRIVKEVYEERYDLIVTNLVNGDMVGHTGVVSAIEKGVEAVDEGVGKVVKAGLEKGYHILIFADHGNAEDQTPEWRTSHTINPVPFILVSEKYKDAKLGLGGLADIAPTVLDIMGIKRPKEMTGRSLIER